MTVTLTIAMGEALAHLADRVPAEDAEYVLAQGRPALYHLLEPHLPAQPPTEQLP